MSDKKSKKVVKSDKKPTISKQGKFIQERLALLNKQKEAEELLLLEQKKKEDEERLAEENALKLIAEKKYLKKQKELDKIKKQKENGTYLTDKQKKDKQQLEHIRNQLLNNNRSSEKSEKSNKVLDSEDSEKSEESSDISKSDNKSYDLRSPIICILGHVDTGKTKMLDYIRKTKIQEGEAGGITQQIGLTVIPINKDLGKYDFPNLIIIDTPGHESFNNLRIRGSNVCDMVILMVDINVGIENQTLESINILKKYDIPYIIALNKIDSLYQWKTHLEDKSLDYQTDDVKMLFNNNFKNIFLQFANNGINIKLYSDESVDQEYINVIPISAKTGEGINEILKSIMKKCNTPEGARDKSKISLSTNLYDKLKYTDEPECLVIDIKNRKGMGSTLDVILKNGIIKIGDEICLSTYDGPLKTRIRSLLTPPILHDMRIKSEYINNNELKATQGLILITADKIDNVIPGTRIFFNDDSIQQSEKEIKNVYNNIKLNSYGVFLNTSSIGSLEALVSFLKNNNIKIGGYNIGTITKSILQKCSIVNENHSDFNVILAFDIDISDDILEEGKKLNINIFQANIIYHLLGQFTKHITDLTEVKRIEALKTLNFPCKIEIIPKYIFHKTDPIIVGVKILDGVVHNGTTLFTKNNDKLMIIGKIVSIQHNKIDVNTAEKGKEVCIKIEQSDKNKKYEMVNDINTNAELYSLISQKDIDTLKDIFKEDYKNNRTLVKSIVSIIKQSIL